MIEAYSLRSTGGLVPHEAALAMMGPAALRITRGHLVSLGDRVAVDTMSLSGENPELARSLELYFRYALSGGWRSGPGAVRLETSLVDATQSTTRSCMRDLGAEVAAMEAVPALKGMVKVLDSSPPSRIRGCRITSGDAGLTVCTAVLTSPMWPVELGGPPSPFEVGRRFRLTASHARWRDRRTRRLVRLEVASLQEWPAPEPLLQASRPQSLA